MINDSYAGYGSVVRVGNVTEQVTIIPTFLLRGHTGEGKGMIFSESGQRLTFKAKDAGFVDSEGNIMYRGAVIFNSNETTGQMTDLDNQIGLYITWNGINGTNWSKTW
jgi:hypothetical protein